MIYPEVFELFLNYIKKEISKTSYPYLLVDTSTPLVRSSTATLAKLTVILCLIVIYTVFSPDLECRRDGAAGGGWIYSVPYILYLLPPRVAITFLIRAAELEGWY